MEMENDADSVALMSMYTEIRRKAGYGTLLHFLFLIHKSNWIVMQVLWLLQSSFSNLREISFSINCFDSYFVKFVRSIHLKCWTMVYVTSKHCFICCICRYIHIYFQWHQSTHANYQFTMNSIICTTMLLFYLPTKYWFLNLWTGVYLQAIMTHCRGNWQGILRGQYSPSYAVQRCYTTT